MPPRQGGTPSSSFSSRSSSTSRSRRRRTSTPAAAGAALLLGGILLLLPLAAAFIPGAPVAQGRPRTRAVTMMAIAAATARQDAQPTLLSFLTTRLGLDTDVALATDALASACKRVSLAVRRAPLERLTGYAGSSTNVGGERQKKLDVLSNDLIKEGLADSGVVAAYASEEEDGVLGLTAGAPLVVACDPLDGSSNVDCSVPTGTIFGIYGALGADDDALHRSALQRGQELRAGGYCLYAATTLFVLAVKGKGTHVFALDPAVGDFVLQRPDVRIPARGASYSLNEGREEDWPEGLQRYVADMKRGQNQAKTPYSLVYVCSLVADVHYVLQRGGMACNPRSHLRLVYEGNPMALVVEEAGGLSSTGGGPRERRILDVVPQALHERIPTFVGSRDDILELESYGSVAQEGTKTYGSVQV